MHLIKDKIKIIMSFDSASNLITRLLNYIATLNRAYFRIFSILIFQERLRQNLGLKIKKEVRIKFSLFDCNFYSFTRCFVGFISCKFNFSSVFAFFSYFYTELSNTFSISLCSICFALNF